jgi:hypothetical protein
MNSWAQKPPVGPVIDPGHSLARGLVLSLPLREGTGPTAYDASGWSNHGVLGSLASWSSDTYGPTIALPGTNSANNAVNCGDGPPLQFGTGPFSAFARFTITNPAAGPYVFAYGSTGALWYARINSSTQIQVAAVGSALLATVPTFASGTRHTIGLTRDAVGNFTAYWDGKAVGSTTGITGSVTSATGLSLGADIYGGSRFFGGNLDCAFAWGRALSAVEVAAMTANPWQVFRPQRDVIRSYSTMPGTGVSYPRGSSILRPVQVPTADLYCYLD